MSFNPSTSTFNSLRSSLKTVRNLS
jgi:hypothetical protein